MDLCEAKHSSLRRHPWEIARSEFFCNVLGGLGVPAHVRSILDAGAGDGFFAGQLISKCSAEARVSCWDAAYSPAQLAELQAAADSRITYFSQRPPGSFDLVLLLDVLEHIEEDEAFLRALVDRQLNAEGWLLVSVPAWSVLFGEHDRHLGHVRRYSPRAVRRLIHSCGLRILQEGGLFPSLLVPRAASRVKEALGLPKRNSDLGEWRQGEQLTRAVTTALRIDSRISLFLANRSISVPGLSHWMVCKR